MIRVLVQLVPSSGEPEREIGRMEIENVSSYTNILDTALGDYSVRVVTGLPNGDTRITQRGIQRYHRRTFNVWGLVHHAIKAMGRDIIIVTENLELPE